MALDVVLDARGQDDPCVPRRLERGHLRRGEARVHEGANRDVTNAGGTCCPPGLRARGPCASPRAGRRQRRRRRCRQKRNRSAACRPGNGTRPRISARRSPRRGTGHIGTVLSSARGVSFAPTRCRGGRRITGAAWAAGQAHSRPPGRWGVSRLLRPAAAGAGRSRANQAAGRPRAGKATVPSPPPSPAGPPPARGPEARPPRAGPPPGTRRGSPPPRPAAPGGAAPAGGSAPAP